MDCYYNNNTQSGKRNGISIHSLKIPQQQQPMTNCSKTDQISKSHKITRFKLRHEKQREKKPHRTLQNMLMN